jgi:hypothetical protein
LYDCQALPLAPGRDIVIHHASVRAFSPTRWIASGLFVSLGLYAPVTRAATDYCGVTIVEDLTLDEDLTCAAGGITVGADGITINLQGHTITGVGARARDRQPCRRPPGVSTFPTTVIPTRAGNEFVARYLVSRTALDR